MRCLVTINNPRLLVFTATVVDTCIVSMSLRVVITVKNGVNTIVVAIPVIVVVIPATVAMCYY